MRGFARALQCFEPRIGAASVASSPRATGASSSPRAVRAMPTTATRSLTLEQAIADATASSPRMHAPSRARQRRNAVISLGLPLHLCEALQPEACVQLLPTRTISDSIEQCSLEDTCSICLADYQAGDELTCMPCDGLHISHAACLRRWLWTDPSCPQCRYTLPPSGASMADLMVRPREALEQRIPPARSTSSHF
jgi:hypothetical protein